MGELDLQLYAFFVMGLAGVAAGMLFDVLRAVRGLGRPAPLAALAADLLFWLAATVVLAGALLLSNWGELRLYVLLGAALGFGLYCRLGSPVLLPAMALALRRLITAATALGRGVGWLVLAPAGAALNLGATVGACLCRFLRPAGRWFRSRARNSWHRLEGWLFPLPPEK